MNRRHFSLFAAGLTALAGAVAYRFRSRLIQRWLDLPPVQNKVRVKKEILIRMPDGVRLAADHYIPLINEAQRPVILIRTPYGRKTMSAFFAQRFAERGYHVLVQDVRGRFDSEGEFVPGVHETTDGLATVAWLRRQHWCNGRVGMWGQSYVGHVQWAVATENPDALQAMVPGVISADTKTLFYPQGILALEFLLRWLVQVDALVADGSPWSRGARWLRLAMPVMSRLLRPLWRSLPLIHLDRLIVGRSVPFYQAHLHHPPTDADYWEPVNYHRRLDDVTTPVHLVSGWHDFLLHGLLADYDRLRRAGHTPYLTIGPWDHFSGEQMTATLRQGLAWMDAHLQQAPQRLRPQPRLRPRPVRLFVMGANVWREFDRWPPPARETAVYLQPQGHLDHTPPPADAPASHYVYDPARPTPSLGGAAFSDVTGPVDNAPLEARPDVLTFTTPPLPHDWTVIGPVRLELWVQSSAVTTDFFGRLCDVDEQGVSRNVCDGIVHLPPDEVTNDQPQPIAADMWATAYQFKQGHRLRLQVSSGAHPRWLRNLGTGESIATAVRMVPAQQTIFHDGERPSALILPVLT